MKKPKAAAALKDPAGHRTTAKMLAEHGMCRACKVAAELRPYNRASVAEMVRLEYAVKGRRWDQALSAVKKSFRPPPGAAEWKTYHIVEIDGDRLNWGGTPK